MFRDGSVFKDVNRLNHRLEGNVVHFNSILVDEMPAKEDDNWASIQLMNKSDYKLIDEVYGGFTALEFEKGMKLYEARIIIAPSADLSVGGSDSLRSHTTYDLLIYGVAKSEIDDKEYLRVFKGCFSGTITVDGLHRRHVSRSYSGVEPDSYQGGDFKSFELAVMRKEGSYEVYKDLIKTIKASYIESIISRNVHGYIW